jgi:IrrE N-terminal-like domain
MSRWSPAEEILMDVGVACPDDIDLRAIAAHVGLKLVVAPLTGCEARVLGNGNSGFVTVNQKSNRLRQRWSVGHEIGHWRHHRGLTIACQSSDIDGGGRERSSPAERAADQFAADLLLPWFLVRGRLRQTREWTWDEVSRLAKEYRVSLTAAAIRLVESNEHPCILVRYENARRSWFVRGRDTPAKWFPVDKPGQGTGAAQVLEGHTKRSERTCVRADDWFSADRRGVFEIEEESIADGQGALTLLHLPDPEMLD